MTVSYQILDGEIKDLIVKNPISSMKAEKDRLILDGIEREGFILGTDDTAVFGYVNGENEFVVDYF